MKTRRLGWTDLELTTVGLGTWAIGGGDYKYGWGPQDDDESVKAIRDALEAGVSWIDTAPIYGLGRSEEVVGRAIKGVSPAPVVATKCGLVWNDEREQWGQLKADSVRNEVEASLRRLDVERIDLYQIHWPNPDEDIEEAWGVVMELVEQGKVRYGGVSNFSVEQMERVGKTGRVASIQPPYSMLRRGVEDAVLPYCAEKEIGVVAYSPMQKGLLTGKFTPERAAALPESDHRSRDKMFKEPQLGANLDVVEGLKAIASQSGHTPAQLAIAWVLRRPEVTAAIVGTRKPGQIEETVKAGDWELSQDEIDAVEALLKKRDGTLKK
ncbi:MAG: aldo/keto reductase [Planctomycetota bacterium]|jgi:aryl-alcohol dehydrogenase-like predicted oxidoreductase